MLYRQGDVLLVAIPKPDLALITPLAEGAMTGVRIAEGELTGHHHVLHGRANYRLDDEQRLIELLEPGELRHQLADGSQAEHDPITLPAGWYRQIQQREYVEPTRAQPARSRRVFD